MLPHFNDGPSDVASPAPLVVGPQFHRGDRHDEAPQHREVHEEHSEQPPFRVVLLEVPVGYGEVTGKVQNIEDARSDRRYQAVDVHVLSGCQLAAEEFVAGHAVGA